MELRPLAAISGSSPSRCRFDGRRMVPSHQQPAISLGIPPMGLLPPPTGIIRHLSVANVNPATNDAPLDFQLNKSKNLPQIEEISANANFHFDESRRERDERNDRLRTDVGIAQGSSSLDGLQHWGMIYPMLADPALMGLVPMGFNQFGFVAAPDPSSLPQVLPINIPNPASVKDIVHCQGCTLFPPNPVAPPPTTRERPPGCRTVFVGGLPENVTEEHIREVFDRCGKICTIRMSKKNFCHIRYEEGSAVDNALFFSGYRIRIGSNGDPPNTGRLHVDYAQARDDLYEWECHNRQLQREMRHRERLEQERLRPASPPSVVHYSDHEASLLAENLKGDDTFQKAVQVLITWLDRGDCNKRNVVQFYSMIQSSNSHMRRLIGEKSQYEEELAKAKEQMLQRMQGIFTQFNQIEKVLMAASHQKVWDHFTKAQRKNIDAWKKMAQDVQNRSAMHGLDLRQEDDMDLCGDEDADSPCKKIRFHEDPSDAEAGQVMNLREENDNLRCQLEAYKNEVDLIKSENKQELDSKEKQLNLLQQALHGMQKKLMQVDHNNCASEAMGSQKLTNSANHENALEPRSAIDKVNDGVREKDARLIGLISAFLQVHPFGAGVDYIWSYLHRLDGSLQPRDVEKLLSNFPTVFRQELTGVGASLERRWKFAGFDTGNVNS